jgi:hypothetical protein
VNGETNIRNNVYIIGKKKGILGTFICNLLSLRFKVEERYILISSSVVLSSALGQILGPPRKTEMNQYSLDYSIFDDEECFVCSPKK